MPDIKAWFREDAFVNRDPRTQQLNAIGGNRRLRQKIADNMECRGDLGETFPPIHWYNIDLRLASIKEYETNAEVIIEIIGFAYAARMENMPDRLEEIHRCVLELLGDPTAKVQISFIPLPQGCWVG